MEKINYVKPKMQAIEMKAKASLLAESDGDAIIPVDND